MSGHVHVAVAVKVHPYVEDQVKVNVYAGAPRSNFRRTRLRLGMPFRPVDTHSLGVVTNHQPRSGTGTKS